MSNLPFKIVNDSGLELTVTTSTPKVSEEQAISVMGGDDRNLSWKDYLEEYVETFQPHILLIKQAIEQLNWIGETGESKANTTYFVFSDGFVFTFSWRAWGDLMSAIVDKNEGYMQYYM